MAFKIAHITTVHPRDDTRIFVKEANDLANSLDAEVALFVQDGLGDETPSPSSPVHLIDTGPSPKGRLKRATSGAWKMYLAVNNWHPDVVHFHDPELIGICLLLRLSGVKVIYDVHEDLPRQILAKHYLSRPTAKILSYGASIVEAVAARCFSGIVAATPVIAARFPKKRTITVCNFPKLSEFEEIKGPTVANRSLNFAYVGGITEIRGGTMMVDAMELVSDPKAKLIMAGNFSPESYGDLLRVRPGWSRVDYKGWVGRTAIAEILSNVRCGIVVLQPTLNYLDSLPVKMFEYMAAGLPVIASDFPLWRKIVEEAGCGLLIDPTDPYALSCALNWLEENPREAEAMGQRGRSAVLETYNWKVQQESLDAFYKRILGEELSDEWRK